MKKMKKMKKGMGEKETREVHGSGSIEICWNLMKFRACGEERRTRSAGRVTDVVRVGVMGVVRVMDAMDVMGVMGVVTVAGGRTHRWAVLRRRSSMVTAAPGSAERAGARIPSRNN